MAAAQPRCAAPEGKGVACGQGNFLLEPKHARQYCGNGDAAAHGVVFVLCGQAGFF